MGVGAVVLVGSEVLALGLTEVKALERRCFVNRFMVFERTAPVSLPKYCVSFSP